MIDCRLQSFDDKSFPDPSDGLLAGIQGCHDFIVGGPAPLTPSASSRMRCGSAYDWPTSSGDELYLKAAFLRNQRDTIAFSITVLLHLMRILRQMHSRNRSSRYPSIRD